MQPSKDFGYTVDPCSALGCEFTRLHDSVSDALKGAPAQCGCGVAGKVEAILDEEGYAGYPVLVLRVPDTNDLQDAEDLISKGKADSYWTIFQHGIVGLAD